MRKECNRQERPCITNHCGEPGTGAALCDHMETRTITKKDNSSFKLSRISAIELHPSMNARSSRPTCRGVAIHFFVNAHATVSNKIYLSFQMRRRICLLLSSPFQTLHTHVPYTRSSRPTCRRVAIFFMNAHATVSNKIYLSFQTRRRVFSIAIYISHLLHFKRYMHMLMYRCTLYFAASDWSMVS